MATTLYTHRETTGKPVGSTSTASPNVYERLGYSANTCRGWLGVDRGSAGVTGTTSTQDGPAETQLLFLTSRLNEFISDPLDTSVTISSSITFNIWASESSMSANAGLHVKLDVITETGDVGSTIIESSRGTELTTSVAANNWSATPTSTTVYRGQRLRLRIYVTDTGGTMASGYTITLASNSSVADTQGDSYITLTENLTFDEFLAGASNTVYYCQTDDSDINPNSIVSKKLWTTTGSTATSVTNTVSGYTSPIQVTSTAGGTALEWYTPQLQAVTIDQAYFFCNSITESSISAESFLTFELAKTNSSGGSASVFCRVSQGSEIPTSTPTAWSITTAYPSVSISDGERIRYRLYVDDGYASPLVTGYTVNFTYGAASGSGTGVGVTLPTLTEYTTGGGGGVEFPYIGGGYYP